MEKNFQIIEQNEIKTIRYNKKKLWTNIYIVL